MSSASSVRRHVAPLAIGIALAVVGALAALVVVGVFALRMFHSVAELSPPYHPENASWRYGEYVVPVRLAGEDIATACRRALHDPVNAPDPLDVRAAVEGCRYGYWLGND